MPNVFSAIETRIVSGVGSLVVPTAKKSERMYSLVVDLVRLPSIDFRNKRFPLDKGKFGNLLFLDSKGYVIRTESVDFEKQTFNWYGSIDGEILYSSQCIAVIQTNNLIALGNALGKTFIKTPFEPQTVPDAPIVTIACECRDDCGLSLRLYSLPYIVCTDVVPSPTPPPSPPPFPPPVPSGQSLNGANGSQPLSPPYGSGTNDPFFKPNPKDSNSYQKTLRFTLQQWDRTNNCSTTGVITKDIPVNFNPTSWTVRSGVGCSGCAGIVPSGVKGVWYVDYANGSQTGTATITDSILSPKNCSIVYDGGTLV